MNGLEKIIYDIAYQAARDALRDQRETHQRTNKQRNSNNMSDEEYVEVMNKKWPNEIPSGNKVRNLFNIGYATSERLLAKLVEQRFARYRRYQEKEQR